jgi:hypothetical protein
MFAFFATFSQRNRVLPLWSWFHVVLLVIALGMAVFDSRLVLSITQWLKTIKLMISIAILLWMLARLAAYLRGPNWAVETIGWNMSLMLLGVTACVSLQAARGTTSSSNIGAFFDTFAFLTRGFTIAIAAVLVLQLLVLFYVEKVMLPCLYLWRIRICLIVFLLASRQGGIINYVPLPLAVLVLIMTRRLLIARRDRFKNHLRPGARALTARRLSN